MTSFAQRVWRSTVRSVSPLFWKAKGVLGIENEYRPVAQDVGPFLDYLASNYQREDPLVILDVGSRHGLEAIEFVKAFPQARVWCFEANPEAIPELTKNVAPHDRITVVPLAVNDFDGECDFWAIDPESTITPHADGNLGASSLYVANSEARVSEQYVQKKIRVACTRLDTFLGTLGLAKVDAIWMDLQGAELMALGTLPNSVFDGPLVIQSELESAEMYLGQGLFSETADYLQSKGMVLAHEMPHGELSGDYIFVKPKV